MQIYELKVLTPQGEQTLYLTSEREPITAYQPQSDGRWKRRSDLGATSISSESPISFNHLTPDQADGLLAKIDEAEGRKFNPDPKILKELEEWAATKDPKQAIIIAGATTYTASRILDEVKRGTQFGREHYRTLASMRPPRA